MSSSIEKTAPLAPRSMRAEAAAWIAKLHGPERSPELEADFKAWLSCDPEHARAFENITDIWDSLSGIKVGGLPRLAAGDAFQERHRGVRLAAAAVVCAAVAVAAFSLLRRDGFVTDVGEQRVVSLEDGTRVSLNSRTRIDVAYREVERLVRLDHGEAFFEVATQPARPFVVVAGDRRITALGTSFAVRYEPNRLDVTLIDGRVTVASLGKQSPSEALRALHSGQRLSVKAGRKDRVEETRTEAAVAWRRGEVILDDTPLAEAVAEMNRYEHVQLILREHALKDLRISGIYRTGDSKGFARAVALAYGLGVVAESEEIYLVAR